MLEFFHGWRRKAGVLMLLVACVFMGGWVRSQFCGDVINIRNTADDQFYVLASANNWLIIGWTLEADWHLAIRLPHVSVVDPNEIRKELRDEDVQWHWRLFGLRYGELPEDFRFWIVPYWSIVLPVTLLSAYLVLVKPRPARIREIQGEPERVL